MPVVTKVNLIPDWVADHEEGMAPRCFHVGFISNYTNVETSRGRGQEPTAEGLLVFSQERDFESLRQSSANYYLRRPLSCTANME